MEHTDLYGGIINTQWDKNKERGMQDAMGAK